MASHKETPRQKMIGMMYLVLTAMLALNVSKEVLDGFTVVNDNVQMTNDDFAQKRKGAYANFEKEYALNKNEVGPFLEKSKKAMKISAEMVNYIESLRDELISKTEKIPLDSARRIPLKMLRKKDNYTEPTRILIGSSEDGSNGKARALKKKIIEYRKKMLNLIDPKYRDQIALGLETDDKYYDAWGKKQSWELHYFYDIPLAADIPILNKFITEVNNAELEVVNGLLHEVSADDFKYDRIEAKVLPKTNYLFTGDQYEAEVIVAAYDTSRSPNVYMMRGVDSLSVSRKDQATLISSQNGRINFKFPVTTPGLQKYAGFVSVYDNSGKENTYHFKNEYFVAQPSLTVSATNMNVLYIGVSNPLSISVSGIPSENIYPTISTGTLRKNKGNGWLVTVPAGCKQTTISVSVKINKGMKQMGTENFRVKKLPDPDSYIASKKEGFVSRNTLIEAGKIIAKMPDDFEFDYSFQIISFKMTMQRGFNVYHYESQSNKLTDEMITQIRNTNRGQGIIFEEIVARDPDGSKRILSPLFITIN
ncbi:MAG: gliding motility protein GldM [Bacteroidales bacterium]|nr:gliding motility protein GldM [Bacteroidales bacterium]